MKTFLATLLLLCSFAFSTTGFAQTTKTDDSVLSGKVSAGGEWNTLEQEGYSIRYPSSWELNQSGLMGTTFFLFSPFESADDLFRENVNLMIQDLTGLNMDLNQYTEISEGQVKTLITNGVIIESKRIKIESGEYHKIIYTGDQGIYNLEYEQYYWIIGNKAYVLTFTGEQQKYAQYKETGEQILNSFVLKK
ncbi:MAG: hypothetical protein HGB11_01190 [Chlorobiales bacterium]|nr:hypothetical protein [Chlorobiales bacterium]